MGKHAHAAEHDDDEHGEEVHAEDDVHVKVVQRPGYFAHIEAQAAIPVPAKTMYQQILAHPDNAAVFRNIDRCTERQIVWDDGRGRRRLKVVHEAGWRFLFLKGKFSTKLDVEEDQRQLSINFSLDPSGGGIMKKFEGRWLLEPNPRDPRRSCLATLEQDLALGVYVPPPFNRLIKSIACSGVKHMLEDTKKDFPYVEAACREAEKINAGKPTLCSWEECMRREAPSSSPPWKSLADFISNLQTNGSSGGAAAAAGGAGGK